MTHIRFTIAIASVLLAILAGGCSLVVDFDRSLLLDAGTDGGGDAGPDAAAETTGAAVKAKPDAALHEWDDAGRGTTLDVAADAG